MTLPPPVETRDQAERRRLWRVSGMGMELTGSIVGMALLGWLVDRWQGTSPLWTLVLLGVGMVGGGYNFLRSARAISRAEADKWKARHHPASPEPGPAANQRP